MSYEVSLSVRALVEYVYSSGSIDVRFRSQSAMIDGTRIHQKIQKTYKEGDQKEVYLRTELPFEDLLFVIDGRCDGLLAEDGGLCIDEIKSFSLSLDEVDPDGYPVHWAQAKLYAYMIATQQNISEIHVQLTYAHVKTDDKRVMRKQCSFLELEQFVFELLKAYAPYAKLQKQHLLNRKKSIKQLDFPFKTYRKGQRHLAGAVYKSILDEKNLFAKAPTGIGKTMSTLYPAVKAIGEDLCQRIFYLTAKTITRTTAEEALLKMRQNGLCLKSVTITAKDKVCFKEETKCQADFCEYANGYYDRVNGAVLDILSNEASMTRDVIEIFARKHSVCPFEFSLDLAYAVDVVVCDYNYIFDPRVSLKRLFEEEKKSSVLLVDEAHNLVDRGREMFSASIQKASFLELKKQFKNYENEISKVASCINAWFIALKKDISAEFVLPQLPGDLVELLEQFLAVAEPILIKASNINTCLIDAYYEVQRFLKIVEFLDDQYVIYGEMIRNNITLKLFCIDPSKLLQKQGKGYRSKIFFSATLTPMPYFQDILGGLTEDYQITIPTPFRQEQFDVFISPLSTRFKDRERTKDKIVSIMKSLLSSRPGNYLIFFPSYQYLLTVLESFKQIDSLTNIIVQEQSMSESEREDFLKLFISDRKESLLGFAVLGGIFSEGVDLVGDRLNGVIVIGVGLPQLCFERNLVKDHFSAKNKNGYDYAYVYPGMNKVLQAGGRLIRTEEDKGTIVLVDDRFLQNPYHSLLPMEWNSYTVI
ncbi:helicase C-terminal domain-containing protein [Bacillus marasmi]|uniref:helicase C-terminal domain-containing protein n=1 Tax=Bacillus marasmi TaxID=1926279 RepID=UPI0011CABB2B|nr:helicase C-terminal domain-containing protein [Bacillus marasmi]